MALLEHPPQARNFTVVFLLVDGHAFLAWGTPQPIGRSRRWWREMGLRSGGKPEGPIAEWALVMGNQWGDSEDEKL